MLDEHLTFPPFSNSHAVSRSNSSRAGKNARAVHADLRRRVWSNNSVPAFRFAAQSAPRFYKRRCSSGRSSENSSQAPGVNVDQSWVESVALVVCAARDQSVWVSHLLGQVRRRAKRKVSAVGLQGFARAAFV